MTFSDIRAVIIDLDGTMLDTAGDFLVAINQLRAELGCAPVDVELVKRYVGKGSENLIARILALDFDASEAEQRLPLALASYQHHYAQINGRHSALFPGVAEGLQALRGRGLRLACVTNKPLAMSQALLEQKGLRSYFELVYGGDSFAWKKPHPYPLLQVCQAFGLQPAQVLAIGDSVNDALAARAAGCPVLTVPYGYNHGEAIQNIDSDGIVETLLAAARLLPD